MKKGNSIWLNITFFLIGTLVSYILCQYKCLDIDPKVNVPATLISLITVLIGLFLAISLKKIQSKSSNLHNYLQPKLDFTWQLFLSLSHQLSLQDQIELSELNKAIKGITQNITPLKKMFTSFGLSNPCIDKLETGIEKLESFLVNECKIEGNIINYSSKKQELRLKLDSIHTMFVDSLKEINKIS